MPRSPRWPSQPVSQRKSSPANAASVASGSTFAYVYSRLPRARRASSPAPRPATGRCCRAPRRCSSSSRPRAGARRAPRGRSARRGPPRRSRGPAGRRARRGCSGGAGADPRSSRSLAGDVRRRASSKVVALAPAASGRGRRADPHGLAVVEVEGAFLGEHVAAAGAEAGDGQPLERPAVLRLQASRAAPCGRRSRSQIISVKRTGMMNRPAVQRAAGPSSARTKARSSRASRVS